MRILTFLNLPWATIKNVLAVLIMAVGAIVGGIVPPAGAGMAAAGALLYKMNINDPKGAMSATEQLMKESQAFSGINLK